jgi:hypothetical protein
MKESHKGLYWEKENRQKYWDKIARLKHITGRHEEACAIALERTDEDDQKVIDLQLLINGSIPLLDEEKIKELVRRSGREEHICRRTLNSLGFDLSKSIESLTGESNPKLPSEKCEEVHDRSGRSYEDCWIALKRGDFNVQEAIRLFTEPGYDTTGEGLFGSYLMF